MRRSTARTVVVVAGSAAVVAAVVAIRAAVASTPQPSPPRPGPSGGTSVSEVQPSSGAEYWTPERMERARPAPMPADDD